jgi:hypothetical protein
MDSELASIANVKALDQSVASGASPTFGTANMTDASNKRFMTDAQETKLDGVDAGAQVNRTASATLTLIKTVDGTTSGLDADLLDGQHGSYYGTASAVSANSTAIGTLSSLSSDIDVDRTNLVAAINELQGDINQINTSGATANNTLIGTLAQLNTNTQNNIVAAINENHTEVSAATTKLSGIEAGANVTDTANVFASLVEGDGIDLDSSSGTISSALVTATSSALGLVKIGYTENGKNYPVELLNGQMFVNVPWDADTDTNTQNQYSTSVVSSSGIKLRLSGTGHNGSTTDDVKFVGAGSSTVSRTDASTITITSTDTNTQRAIHDTPVDGATTTSISSNWAFDNVKTPVPSGAVFTDTDTNTQRAIHDTPVDGATTTSISSNWAFDNVKTPVPSGAVFTDTNTNTQLSNEQVQDIVGGMLGGTETGITVTYQDGTGDIDFVVTSQTQNDFTNTLKAKLDGIESNLNAFVEPSQALTTTASTVADAINELKAAIPLVFNAAGSQLN